MSARILLVDDDKALLDALPEALRLRMHEIEIDTSETAVVYGSIPAERAKMVVKRVLVAADRRRLTRGCKTP